MNMMLTLNRLDPLLVKEEINKQFIAHGYFRVNRAGEQVVDDTQMKTTVYEAVKKKIARAREEVVKNSLTNGELYAIAFPDAPGTDPKSIVPLDALQREVRKGLMRKVWGLTQPRRVGFVQKRLGAEGTGMILCKTM